tara:strand:- start:8899 stop:9219 length:321 start_codon:yes stop_codon:yes gene_type:complete
LPRSPVQPFDLAQNDLRRLAALLPGLTLPVTGAFSLPPVALLYLALPFAVKPAPLDAGNFSPRPTDSRGSLFFFVLDGISSHLFSYAFCMILLHDIVFLTCRFYMF